MRRRPEPISPRPGQESVWDYPRPPALELAERRIQIELDGVRIADAPRAYRVLETSHPPTWYIAPEHLAEAHLQRTARSSFCEWKGQAFYVDVVVGDRRLSNVGWGYDAPTPRFAPIAGHIAFYAGPFDRVTVDGIEVVAQPGGFYGGWITPDVVGPFKGIPGSMGW